MKCLTKLSVTILACAALLTGCAAVVDRSGHPFFAEQDLHCFDKLVNDSLTNCTSPDSTYKTSGDEKLALVGAANNNYRSECLKAPIVLRFVWFSDVHVRQREVKLFDRRLSKIMARTIIPSFERNEFQEGFHWAVYLSLIDSTNKLNVASPLDFMMHTGDAIDSGSIEELYQFMYVTDRLKIPWFNAIGNHDASIFGNYENSLVFTQEAGVSFYFVGNNENFIRMNGPTRYLSGFGLKLLPVPEEGGHIPSRFEREGKSVRPTCYHGFDLCPDCGPLVDCTKAPIKAMGGYYSFDVRNTTFPIRVIVLNTARSDSWGEGPETDEARLSPQRGWLKEALQTQESGVVLLFMHHRPGDLDDETLNVLLKENKNRLVVFSGHTHKNAFRKFENSSHETFYELNTGSVLEYPQMGRLIELRGPFGNEQTEPRNACLVSRAFWTSDFKEITPGVAPEALEKEARQYMEREEPRLTTECNKKERDWSKEPSLAAQCGHWGSYKNYVDDAYLPPWGVPQPVAEALKAINVIIPLQLR